MRKKVLSIGVASLLTVGGIGAVLGSSGFINQVSAAQTDQGMISKDRAAQIAKDKYGGEVINVEMETEQGKKAYEVEMRNTSQGRIEVDVAAATGKIIDVEKEDHDSDEDVPNDVHPKISINDARQIALSRQEGRVNKLKLDEDDGKIVYKVEVKTQKGLKYDFKIDANSGNVIEMELDD